MAISVLGSVATQVRNNSSGTTITASHTLAAGANRIVVAWGAIEDDNAIASATYGGVAMTALTEKSHSTGGTATRIRMFYLLNASLPADGANNCVMTSTDAFLSGCWHVVCIQDAKQQAPEDTGNGESATNATVDTGSTLTTITANAFIISGFACNNNTSSSTYGTGQSELADTASGASNSVTMVSSTETKVAAGADTQSTTFAASNQENVAFAAAFEAILDSNFFFFF